ncbi:hypothetical protein IK7_06356 [Bacillus cereus VD156]|nr:hypothetical protein IK7_06356 [Bacillus cereus VD156]
MNVSLLSLPLNLFLVLKICNFTYFSFVYFGINVFLILYIYSDLHVLTFLIRELGG